MSFMERSMENAFEKRVKSDVKHGMENLGIGRAYGFGTSKPSDDSQGINWQDYNYPPYVRVIHYNQAEIPSTIAEITKFQKIFFEVQTFIQCYVTFNSLILMASASGYAAKLFLYAILNVIIIVPLCLFTFYQGYRGLAISSNSLLTQYKVLHGVFLIFSFLFVFVPMGAVNGFGRFGTDAYKTSDGKGYWSFAIVTESLLNGVNFMIGARCLYQVMSFNPFAPQTTQAGVNQV